MVKKYFGDSQENRLFFIGLICFLIVFIFKFLSCMSYFFPFEVLHDTLQDYYRVAMMYKGLSESGELPYWAPYVAYGSPNYILRAALDPFFVLPMIFGFVFGVKDPYPLYIISNLFSELVMCAGVYLSARRLGLRKHFAMAAVIIVFGAMYWGVQNRFQLVMVWSIPVLFYFILRLFESKTLKYLALIFLTLSVTIHAQVVYAIPLLFMLVGVFLIIVYFMKYQADIGTFRLRKYDVFFLTTCFAVLCASCAFVYYLQFGLVEDAVFRGSSGRLADGTTTLNTYLTYGVREDHIKSLLEFFFATPLTPAMSFYFGLTSFILVLSFPILMENINHYLVGLIIALILLLSFSTYNPLATILYYIMPMLDYFRHWIYIRCFLPFFFSIAAAFVMQRIAYNRNGITNQFFAFIFIIYIFAILYSIFFTGVPYVVYDKTIPQDYYLYAMLFSIVFFLLLFNKSLGSSPFRRSVIILIFICIEATSTMFVKYYYISKVYTNEQSAEHVFALNFEPKRNTVEELKKNIRFTRELELPYSHKNDIFQHFLKDPCLPYFRSDIATVNVNRLFELRFSKSYFDYDDTENSLDFLGCNKNKIYVPSSVLVTNDHTENENHIRSEKNLYENAIVLNAQDSKLNPDMHIQDPSKVKLKIVGFSYNEVNISVTNHSEKPTFIAYLDSYDKQWQASIDGQKIPVYLYNRAFKAVLVPVGSYHLTFLYKPPFIEKITIYMWVLSGCIIVFLLVLLSKEVRETDAEKKADTEITGENTPL